MEKFTEFLALCRTEKSKEEQLMKKTIYGEVEDLYLPGFKTYLISIQLSNVVAFNQDDSENDNDCTFVWLREGQGYKIQMRYEDFKTLINTKQ